MLLSSLIKKIKSKKSLQNLDDSIVREQIQTYLKKNFLSLSKINKKQLTNLLKTIRKNLHETYGVFQLNLKKRNFYFEQLKSNPNSLQLHNKILQTHASTKERLEIYPILYKKLFNLTIKKPNSILDLSAGLNPFSFPYLKLKNVKYIATELTSEDCNFIQQYFNLKKIKGTTLQLNLFKAKSFPKADLTFIFKTFHSLEKSFRKAGYLVKTGLEKSSFKLTESILKKLNSKFIIISFPIKTISNKKMNFPYYPGFERLLSRLNFKYKKLLLKNELFFIINRNI